MSPLPVGGIPIEKIEYNFLRLAAYTLAEVQKPDRCTNPCERFGTLSTSQSTNKLRKFNTASVLPM